jgi:tRNA-dihydrouridine synthase B
MNIGALAIDPPFVLAPLAGYTDSPARRLARRFGASMVWTEMVSAEGAIRGGDKTLELLRFHSEERPICVQLFGARPEAMARAAALVERLAPDAIDLNVGCPARKVVKGGAGAALMRAPDLLSEIAEAVVGATSLPVTAKIRSGWDEDSVNAVEIAALLEDRGVAAVVVHPRTRAQGFSGVSDWSVISDVRRAVAIPVIGSGDVSGPADAVRMLSKTSCDGVMIGRAAVGNPWVFRECAELLASGHVPPPPELRERITTVIDHLDMMVESKGERRGVFEMRKHIVAYFRGFPGASRLRSELVRMEGHRNVRDRLTKAKLECG